MIEGLLRENGIESLTQRNGGFDVPDFLAAGPRDVLVPESGVELARITLRKADVEPVAVRVPEPASRAQVARIVVGIVAAGAVAALIAWALVQATS
jgi:hypothetical protein